MRRLYSKMLYTDFGWRWLRGPGEKDSKISSVYARFYVIVSPWKKAGSFIWTKLILYPSMLCVRVVEIGTVLVVLEKEMNMWKVYNNDDNNDKEISIGNKARLSFELR